LKHFDCGNVVCRFESVSVQMLQPVLFEIKIAKLIDLIYLFSLLIAEYHSGCVLTDAEEPLFGAVRD